MKKTFVVKMSTTLALQLNELFREPKSGRFSVLSGKTNSRAISVSVLCLDFFRFSAKILDFRRKFSIFDEAEKMGLMLPTIPETRVKDLRNSSELFVVVVALLNFIICSIVGAA